MAESSRPWALLPSIVCGVHRETCRHAARFDFVVSVSLTPRDGDDRFRRAAGWNETCDLRDHAEFLVALQRAARGGHSHKARGCAIWYASLDITIRDNGERSCGTVKADPGHPPQILPQDFDGGLHLARGRQGLHERGKPHRETEDRATATTAITTTAAGGSCPVERSVGGLDQPGGRVAAVSAVEAMLRSKRATRGDFEDCATAIAAITTVAENGCPVEISICTLHQ